MENKRPSIIPTKEMIEQANSTGEEIARAYEQQVKNGNLPQYELEKAKNNMSKTENVKLSELHGGQTEVNAAAEMKRLTEEQIRLNKQGSPVTQSLYYEKNQAEVATVTSGHYQPLTNTTIGTEKVPETKAKSTNDIVEYTGPYDLLELPSKGLIYPHKIGKIKVGFLTAADENILTSPNLLESGKFLEVLLDRKILTPGIYARDLHVGDRNALMIWLRATGYGEIYPIQVNHPETDELIEADIDLNILKVKNLDVLPDEEGLFHYELPRSKKLVKFKLLTVGEEEDIEDEIEKGLNEVGSYYSKASTLTLEKQIIEIGGVRDINKKKDIIANLPIMDSMSFKKYLNTIECGIDLRITVGVPGGEPFETFLPINTSFFWPEL